MLTYKIYTGDNCHADVVVEGADQHPEYLVEAQGAFAELEFEISPEAILGNFCVWGAAHHESETAKLTAVELARLESLGEVISRQAVEDSFRFLS